jgi:hypothetical protein
MKTPDTDIIHYRVRTVPLPDKPRKVNVKVTRTADGLWRTEMPVEDLNYLIALEFERQRRLGPSSFASSEPRTKRSVCTRANKNKKPTNQ